MRFRFERPKAGDMRRKKVFLLFPKQLDNDGYRWFCFTEIFQIYSAGGSSTGYDYMSSGWKDVGWSDKVKGIKIGQQRFGMFASSPYSEFEIEYSTGHKDPINKRLEAIK